MSMINCGQMQIYPHLQVAVYILNVRLKHLSQPPMKKMCELALNRSLLKYPFHNVYRLAYNYYVPLECSSNSFLLFSFSSETGMMEKKHKYAPEHIEYVHFLFQGNKHCILL